MKLAEFDFEVRHINGSENVDADALPRPVTTIKRDTFSVQREQKRIRKSKKLRKPSRVVELSP